MLEIVANKHIANRPPKRWLLVPITVVWENWVTGPVVYKWWLVGGRTSGCQINLFSTETEQQLLTTEQQQHSVFFFHWV